MKKLLIIGILSLCLLVTSAQPITERFSHHTDLRPYLEWISANTRFTNAASVRPIELPSIYLLDNLAYARVISIPSFAVYSAENNSIYVNLDRSEGRPEVIIHELIHYFQAREKSKLTLDEREQEAYAIQSLFNSQRKP